METKWTPCTASDVPQPAGHECADWYELAHPTAEDILYALAHTKGECDRLRAVNAELLAALQVIEAGFSDGSIKWTKPRQADNEPYHTANVLMTAALAKAQQS